MSQADTILAAIQVLAGRRNCPFAPGAYVPSDTSILEDEERNVTKEEKGEDKEEEAAKPRMGLEELRAFMQALASQAIDEGVSDLALRRAARALKNLTPLVEALATSDFRQAQEEALADHASKRELLAQAQARVDELGSRPFDTSSTDVIVNLAKARLDAILTASAQRLQGELFAMALKAQAKHTQLGRCSKDFDEAREELVTLADSLTVATARLALLWERRDDVADALTRYEQIERQARITHSRVLASEQKAALIGSSFDALEGNYAPARDRGTTLLRSLRELVSAARVLGVTLPRGILGQIEKATEPLDTTLTFCGEQFRALDPPQMDEKLRNAITNIEEQRTRKEHLTSPIRPSVFARRLDRDEEVRRLVLIAFYAFILAEPERAKDGRGKGTGIGALVEANLIDQIERERALEYATDYKDARPKLMEAIQYKKFWRYRPTQAGATLARQWLDECVNPGLLIEKLENGRRNYAAKYREQRRPRSAERATGTEGGSQEE